MSPAVSRHRPRLLQAAVDLLADSGTRALSHGALDRRAGVPAGTASNYYRTSFDLLAAVLDHLVQKDREAIDALSTELGRDTGERSLLALCVRMVDFLTGPGRSLSLARYALFLEASHYRDLAGRVAAAADDVRTMAATALVHAGVPQPEDAAEGLLATIDGLVLARVAYNRSVDTHAVLAPLVAALYARDER